jgi:hypothetical protein
MSWDQIAWLVFEVVFIGWGFLVGVDYVKDWGQ